MSDTTLLAIGTRLGLWLATSTMAAGRGRWTARTTR